MNKKLVAFAVSAVLLPLLSSADEKPPSVVCPIRQSLWLSHLLREPQSLRGPFPIYRIDQHGRLFKKEPSGQEQFYNTVSRDVLGRYTSGYKTIYFEREFSKATFVHVDQTSVRVEYADCVQDD